MHPPVSLNFRRSVPRFQTQRRLSLSHFIPIKSMLVGRALNKLEEDGVWWGFPLRFNRGRCAFAWAGCWNAAGGCGAEMLFWYMLGLGARAFSSSIWCAQEHPKQLKVKPISVRYRQFHLERRWVSFKLIINYFLLTLAVWPWWIFKRRTYDSGWKRTKNALWHVLEVLMVLGPY